MSKTLSEKVWDEHVVHRADGEPDLLFIDLHSRPRGDLAPGVRRLRMPAGGSAGPI